MTVESSRTVLSSTTVKRHRALPQGPRACVALSCMSLRECNGTKARVDGWSRTRDFEKQIVFFRATGGAFETNPSFPSNATLGLGGRAGDK
jgi:hypothetical protein